MRHFLAIPLPEEVKRELHDINTRLSKFKGLRFVSPDNMHLTLLFLGENGALTKIDDLKKIKFKPFSLKISKIVIFPEQGMARLVWAELEDSKNLLKLQKDLSKAFKINQEYKPHITLARIKKLERDEREVLKKLIQKIKIPKLSFEVKNFKLYSSELTVLGPVHRVVEYFESSNNK